MAWYIFFTNIILFIIQAQLASTSAFQNKKFSECQSIHQCGAVNLAYPFFSSRRPQYCGYPGFKLENCEEEDSWISMQDSYRYIVLGINNTLTIVRNDLRDLPNDNNTCPSAMFNTTIDLTRFHYTSNDQNITFFYDCDDDLSQLKSLDPKLRVNCTANGRGSGHYMTNRLISEYGIQNLLVMCKSLFFVPAFINDINRIDKSRALGDVINAFQHGFEVAWIADNVKCLECKNSGGVCGSTNMTFVCHCADHTYQEKCLIPASAGSNFSRRALVGIFVGIFVAAVVLLGIIYGKKKRLLSSEETKSNCSTTPLQHRNSQFGVESCDEPEGSSHFESSNRFTNSQFGVQLFTSDELEEATGHFDKSRELGHGGFSTVYCGTLTDGRLVAVKRFKKKKSVSQQFMNEIKILAHLRHKNLVTLYGCTSRSRRPVLVYEYISNGTLAGHIHGTKNQLQLPWQVRLNIAVETAEALAFLHASNVVHCDVKTTNILLDKNNQVKVADFGISRLFPIDVTHITTSPRGTFGYIDPEFVRCCQLTEKSDVYSFGVVLMELISSKEALEIGRDGRNICLSNMAVDKIQNNCVHELVDSRLGYENDAYVHRTVKGVAELAFRCLQPEKDDRPTMTEVLDALRQIQNVQTIHRSLRICKSSIS